MGLGLSLGSPTGITGKYFLTDIHAVDFGWGSNGETVLWADYLWHGWKAFDQLAEGPIAENGRLVAVLGVGGRFENEGSGEDDKLGVRGVLGASYFMKKAPVEFTLEMAPVINIVGGGSDFDVALAVRYYFLRFN